MSKVYTWYSVFDCLPGGEIKTSKIDGGERYTLLVDHSEFTKKLADAMYSGVLKVYDKNAVLLCPPTDIELGHYLNPIEVNKWFLQNDLPYRWQPSDKLIKESLQDRVDSGELKEAVLDVVKHLRAIGTPKHQIDREAVSKAVESMPAWNFNASSLHHKIKASWWK
jgi:hypothetical protein